MDEKDDKDDSPKRVYVPPNELGVDISEYLKKYAEREFPPPTLDKNSIYSIPNNFNKSGQRQAISAEQVVFTKLRDLSKATEFTGLWMTFFHSRSYAGRSYRNHRLGKLMIREHDFVIFAKYRDKHFIALSEVKSTKDCKTSVEDATISSDSKVIKNNKRSALHQLRDHIEIIGTIVGSSMESIQTYVMWPYLGCMTKDPKHIEIRRWKEDKNLHVFEDVLSNQKKFNKWFKDNILEGPHVNEDHFSVLFQRYIELSCGVIINCLHKTLLTFLTKEQMRILDTDWCQKSNGKPLVIHGAAGTGKTFLVLKKLRQLYETARLDESNRALYICYGPGVRYQVQQKLVLLGINHLVDTEQFYISHENFLQNNTKSYKHIFVDESEAICLTFKSRIVSNTIAKIFQMFHKANCFTRNCSHEMDMYVGSFENITDYHYSNSWGELWFMVDVSQASFFLSKHCPKILRKPQIALDKIMRNTENIFQFMQQFHSNPIPTMPKHLISHMHIPLICKGHGVVGPSIFWVDSEGLSEKETQDAVVRVIIDLSATKGFPPNDICLMPFLCNKLYQPKNINSVIEQYFVENGYRPKGVSDIEKFVFHKEVNDFLIAWALNVKGLEFKVVITVLGDDEFDCYSFEDRKRAYLIATRCTCVLIVICSKQLLQWIDPGNVKKYTFCKNLCVW